MKTPLALPFLRARIISNLAHLLPSFSLVGWGLLILFFQNSGLLPVLQHPRFHFLTVSCAWLLILSSVLRLALQNPSPTNILYAIIKELLLLLPLFMFLLFPFSQNQANSLIKTKDDSFLPSSHVVGKDLSWVESTGVVAPNLVELLLVCADTEKRDEIRGKTVILEGQYMPAENGYKLTRLYMFCCAADVQTIEVRIEGIPPDGLKEKDWFRITGDIHFSGPKEQLVLFQKSVERIPQPKHIYIYSGDY